MKFDDYLQKLREKWSQVPAGSIHGERFQSADLLRMESTKLLSFWDAQFEAGLKYTRYWYQKLYFDLIKGARVLEIGPGMGFDGLFFGRYAKQWTYCDVAQENLEVIRRISSLKSQGAADTLYIDRLAAFDNLADNYDVVWANGSLINLPFELAQQESRAILAHLKPNGRWIELTYPPERWAREGGVPFDKWGLMTDGENTPWVECYDTPKLKRRLFPAAMRTVLQAPLSSSSCFWIDLEYLGRAYEFDLQEMPIGLPTDFAADAGIWRQCATIELDFSRIAPSKVGLAVDLNCTVERGTLGFGFVSKNGAFVGEEMIVSSRDFSQFVTIETDSTAAYALSIRNAGEAATSMRVHRAVLRQRI